MSLTTIGQIRRGESNSQVAPPRYVTASPESVDLPGAMRIADLVWKAYKAGYQVPLSTAISQADGKIETDQRFYDVEFQGAALRLATFEPIESADSYYIGLKNNMGWRLVDIVPCRYGYVVDMVTRECVEAGSKPPVIPPVDTYTAPDDIEAGAKIPTWLLVIGGLAGFLMLTQRRK